MDDKERARQRYEQRTASAWYKLSEGANTFRVLPTPKLKDSPGNFYEYMMHREVGPRKQQLRCGKDYEGNGKCWLCDSYIPALKKKGQDVRAAALVSKIVFLIQVAKVNDAGKMAGPLLYSPPKTISDQILSMFFSKKKTYQDPVKGYNLTITRTGTGRNDTRYSMIEADEEPTPVPESIIAKLKPFSALSEVPTYAEAKQKAAISGQDYHEEADDEEEQVEDDEEEDTEVEDDEEDDDTEVDEDEVEEEEPAPPPKKKAAAAPPAKKAAPPPAPAKKAVSAVAAPTKKKAAPPPPVEEEVEEEDEEVEPELDDEEINLEDEEIDLDGEDEEEPEPPPPPKKAVKKVKK